MFTKFDDFEPLERQDADMTRRLEREAILGVEQFDPRVVDLKVDLFGPVAVSTFVMRYAVVRRASGTNFARGDACARQGRR